MSRRNKTFWSKVGETGVGEQGISRGMIIVCSDCGKSLTRNGKLDTGTFPELFTNFHAVTAMARCSLTFNWTPHDCRDHLQKPLHEKNNHWIILFLCQPSVELLYNICVRVALVNRHNKQIRTNLSQVPLAYRLTCTIYDIVDQSLRLRKGPSCSNVDA